MLRGPLPNATDATITVTVRSLKVSSGVYTFGHISTYIDIYFVLNEIIVLGEENLNKNLFENEILSEFQPTKIFSLRVVNTHYNIQVM